MLNANIWLTCQYCKQQRPHQCGNDSSCRKCPCGGKHVIERHPCQRCHKQVNYLEHRWCVSSNLRLPSN